MAIFYKKYINTSPALTCWRISKSKVQVTPWNINLAYTKQTYVNMYINIIVIISEEVIICKWVTMVWPYKCIGLLSSLRAPNRDVLNTNRSYPTGV